MRLGDRKKGNTKKKYLRIAMLGHKRIPSREGGIEIVVEELSKRLVKAGHSVCVYNRKGDHVSGTDFGNQVNSRHMKSYQGIKIRNIPTFQKKELNAPIYSLIATLHTLFGRYDCIHYHAEGPCAMLWLPHLFGIRTIATIHGLDWQRAKWGGFASRYLKFGEKIAAKYADEVIVLSKNAQQYFMDSYNRKVRFIPNATVRPELKSDHIISDKWGLHKDDYILYLGRIVPEKGIQYLIEAYQGTSISKKLVIAGGSSHTDDFMSDIRSKAAQDRRIILTDFVQGEVLHELYSNAYLYILPSDVEGMPLSLLEAMSYGNCCVVSGIPENMEVVEDKAISFRKSDVADLRDKLEWLIRRPDVVHYYKSLASDYICNKYDWDKVTAFTEKLYVKNYNSVDNFEKSEGLL